MGKRVFLIVLDSFGIGGAADAKDYGDEGSNTLKSVFSFGFSHANFERLGLFSIDGVTLKKSEVSTLGDYAALHEESAGKDTTTGHWELAGLITKTPFDTFPEGFPKDIISALEGETKRKILCNLPYSGTKVLLDFAEEQKKTGGLIVYTSADSVLQIAANEKDVSREELYSYCRTARKILDNSPYRVARVIARPYVEEGGVFVRTEGRHDFSLVPKRTMLNELSEAGLDVIGVGKISDIFAGSGLTRSLGVNKNNADGMQKTLALLNEDFNGLCFVNLVDGDTLFGHRRDVEGYARCLSEFDCWLGEFLEKMREGDAVCLTGDHGCDPAFRGTDHTRERVPFLWWEKGKTGKNLGEKGFSFVAKRTKEFLLKGEGV